MTGPTRAAFDARVDAALGDATLQGVVKREQDYMHALTARAGDELDWPALLRSVETVREHTVAHLPHYVDEFATNVERAGGHVFFAADAAEARAHIVGLASARAARLIVKSKSMVTEEIGLNPALEEMGARVVETDLGEFIVQLAGERPFHIVGPAMHKTLGQIAELFSAVAGEKLDDDPGSLVRFARRHLRAQFLAADMGISGCNFGVAATGSVVLVTNEGNGRMTTTLPRTHVVVMGMERLVPDLPSLEPLLAVLPWAGVGARITTYVSVITGPRRAGDADGPEELHVVIVDNGRSSLLGTPYQSVLHCIRCGACLDVCPVFRKIGGHAYDAVYSGPIGAVLSPLLEGYDRHPELPWASSLCGACSEVCSARIPLADHLLRLRGDAVGAGEGAAAWAAGLRGFAEVTRRPRVWGCAEDAAGLAVRPFARGGWLSSGPGPLGAWTRARDFPAFARRSFRRLWARRPRSPGGGAP